MLTTAYKELQDLVSPKMQYSNYRKALKIMKLPALPFLGVFLTDLTFLDLGNPDFLPDNHYINMEKRRKVYNLILEIQKYQKEPYELQVVPQILGFLAKIGDKPPSREEKSKTIMTEDELYEKSNILEAKVESSDEED
jgi:hypothetical protein